MEACVAAGYAVDEPEDLVRWASDPGRGAILNLHDKRAASALERLREAGVVVVGVLAEHTVAACRQALTDGAVSLLPRSAGPEAVVAVLADALAGRATLPVPLVRSLGAEQRRRGLAENPGRVTAQELTLLRLMAQGSTVTFIAREQGIAERTVYRRLAQLYLRLGVRGRIEAIARAFQWGLLDLSKF